MQTGSLYLVATPIGNLEDITLRTIRILKEVDQILCENSKNSYKLLQNYEIKTPSKTLFSGQANSFKWIVDEMKSGKSFAYISDAGTPGISDPGAGLVRSVRKEGFPIIPIPGPSALGAILSVSGFQTNPTFFLGFLSEKPEVLVGRELTKAHEEIKLYKTEEINPESIYPKGEFVVLINNYVKKIAKEKSSSTDMIYRER